MGEWRWCACRIRGGGRRCRRGAEAHSVAAVMDYFRAHGTVSQWSFLTGSGEQLKAVWADYHVAALVESGDISHTPATFLIDQQGRLKKAHLSQMAYSAIGQPAQVVAQDAARAAAGSSRAAR